VAYIVLGTAGCLAVYRYAGIAAVRKAFPWPNRLVVYPTVDRCLLLIQSTVLLYLLYTRYHMDNFPSLSLPCHLGLVLCLLMVSPVQNNRSLWVVFATYCVPLAGGGLLGILFRDRDVWSMWVPPLYDEMFLFEHALVFVVFHYIFLFKFAWRAAPYAIPSHVLPYALFGVTPAWGLLHWAWWQPLSLLTGFNLHYMLCPFGKVAAKWPLPPALWPAIFALGSVIIGCVWFFAIELPLLNFALRLLGGPPPRQHKTA